MSPREGESLSTRGVTHRELHTWSSTQLPAGVRKKLILGFKRDSKDVSSSVVNERLSPALGPLTLKRVGKDGSRIPYPAPPPPEDRDEGRAPPPLTLPEVGGEAGALNRAGGLSAPPGPPPAVLPIPVPPGGAFPKTRPWFRSAEIMSSRSWQLGEPDPGKPPPPPAPEGWAGEHSGLRSAARSVDRIPPDPAPPPAPPAPPGTTRSPEALPAVIDSQSEHEGDCWWRGPRGGDRGGGPPPPPPGTESGARLRRLC